MRLRTLRRDEGTNLLEVAVATMVMAIAVTGIIGTMTSGMGLVGHSRQRSSGSNVALERLERVRDLPYDNVALTSSVAPLPSYTQDETNPDHEVLPATVGAPGTSLRVNATTTEPLIIAPDGILHIDDPVTVGGTDFVVHQYVTWVDDGAMTGTENYKRITVVVTWKFPVKAGVAHRVVQSTFVSRAAIGENTPAPSVSPTPSPSGTPAPTATPTATPPPAGSCSGDTTPPTSTAMTLLSGTGAIDPGFTNSTTIQVQLQATDTCAPIAVDFSNDNATFTPGVATLTSGAQSTVTWTIPTGNGSKTVYTRFRDAVDNTSATLSRTITLDQSPPTAPGNLRKTTCTTSGNDRTVGLTWDASTDPSPSNLVGYRLYRSTDSGAFEPVTTTTTLSASDTHRKNSGSVRFVARGYDKAGNESVESNIRSFSKSSCA